MSRATLAARLARLEEDQPITRHEIWRQADGGADHWTCDAYPRAYNRSELDVLPLPPSTRRILVARVGPESWPR